MDSRIVSTTNFRDNLGCKVFLKELQDGRKHVHKIYTNSENTDEEWDALCYLYNPGFNVPKPYKKDEQGMYMQYIDSGMLWNSYQIADTATQQELIDKFTKLLYDLHTVTSKNEPTFNGFIQNELAEIKTIMERKQFYPQVAVFHLQGYL